MIAFQSGSCSGMANPRDAGQRVDELFPARAMAGQHAASFGSDPVKPLAALAGLLHPAPGDEAALLEAVEHRVERGDVELEHAAGPLLDQLADLVAVPGP